MRLTREPLPVSKRRRGWRGEVTDARREIMRCWSCELGELRSGTALEWIRIDDEGEEGVRGGDVADVGEPIGDWTD
jgi:hypothetical protein